MSGIQAPQALRPCAPKPPSLGRLKGAPSFQEHAAELELMQATGRELQDMANSGKRLVQAATTRLQHGDVEGAVSTLEELGKLRSPREVMGEDLWADPVRRLRLCEANQVAWFMQGHLQCLTLMSFFQRGVLAPKVPDSCRIGIADQDDERYLLGILDALRELERYAVNRGQALDLESIRVCLAAAQCLEQALMQFDFRNSELRRRFDGVKYSVRKFENLAYEVDLALQRAAAAAAAAAASAAASTRVEGAEAASVDAAASAQAAPEKGQDPGEVPSAVAIDLPALAAVKFSYDKFDAMREIVIKRSRDVLKAAKNSIYALQRSDFRKADAELKQCAKEASAIHEELVVQTPTLRGGLFSAALEEMAEALAFRAFRREQRLLGRAEMQAESGLSFPMALHEYLGGLMDLTGEVGRQAIKSTQKGRKATGEVELCLACVDAVHTGARDLPYLPMGLGKKMGGLRGTLAKIEGALYELALLSQGLRVQAPSPAEGGGGEDDEPEQDQKATSRM